MTESGRQRRRLTATVTDLERPRQKVFLVGVLSRGTSAGEAERSLDELALLVDTAGGNPVDSELVRRDVIDPALFIGSGKASELADLTRATDIDTVVFDNQLSPAQQRNLQKLFECDVVDREAVILDIFAQHATSRIGAIQVELALLRYNLPRLRGKGTSLSQQAGGIGARRGPGETKLETDRRRIERRITRLERDLKDFDRTRETQTKARRRSQIPVVSLVGYTNAGKSTLLNTLTGAGVLTEDRLFSTLDSTVRKYELPNGRSILLSDTVGFVRRLPHHLIEAFRSTLDQVKEADLLLHLVDASDPDPERQIEAVRTVLSEIDAGHLPEIIVINKADQAEPATLNRLANLHPNAVVISALTGEGILNLADRVGTALDADRTVVRLEVPYARGDIVAAAHAEGEVVAEKHDDSGTIIDVWLPRSRIKAFADFQVS
ncbi:MAG TPA: GTPase HflX [Acidimicrobiia bacterium]|nr:GTPase HflX [Acidimicrobiia bacterium]